MSVFWRKVFRPSPWVSRAACVETDPEVFFPNEAGEVAKAKAVCRRCEARESCLLEALDNHPEVGIWGGLTEQERARLLKNRANA